ncbi:hypothetical protein U1Q18_023531, partial [Sarracenia purpurea var. burkii]
NGDCIIGGAKEDHGDHLGISLHNVNSFLESSELSATVWMLKSRDLPDMLNCPVGPLGNISFYFIHRDQ